MGKDKSLQMVEDHITGICARMDMSMRRNGFDKDDRQYVIEAIRRMLGWQKGAAVNDYVTRNKYTSHLLSALEEIQELASPDNMDRDSRSRLYDCYNVARREIAKAGGGEPLDLWDIGDTHDCSNG